VPLSVETTKKIERVVIEEETNTKKEKERNILNSYLSFSGDSFSLFFK
jgi:hypothetical protein